MDEPGRLRAWWERNKKWAAPVGIVVILALTAALIGGFVLGISTLMKRSDVYQEALARARGSHEVVEAIGEPVEPGFFVLGNINLRNSSGDADLTIPISGPRGKGTVYVRATKEAGRWDMQLLEVAIQGRSERIDLLHAPRARASTG